MIPAEKLSRALILGSARDPKALMRAKVRGFVLAWSFFVALGCLTVSAWAGATMRDYQIDRLQSALRDAVQENLELRAEAAQLTSPRRLLAYASRLHYGTPTREFVVRVELARPAGKAASFWHGWAHVWTELKARLARAVMAF